MLKHRHMYIDNLTKHKRQDKCIKFLIYQVYKSYKTLYVFAYHIKYTLYQKQARQIGWYIVLSVWL